MFVYVYNFTNFLFWLINKFNINCYIWFCSSKKFLSYFRNKFILWLWLFILKKNSGLNHHNLLSAIEFGRHYLKEISAELSKDEIQCQLSGFTTLLMIWAQFWTQTFQFLLFFYPKKCFHWVRPTINTCHVQR